MFKQSNNKVKIIVEDINYLSIIFLKLKNLNKFVEFIYDENSISNKRASLIRFITKRNMGMDVRPIKLTLNAKDDKGFGLEYKKNEEFKLAIDNFCDQVINDEPEWFVEMTKCYIISLLYQRLTFLFLIVRWIEQTKERECEIWLNGHFLNYIIMDYYQKQGILINQISCFFGLLKHIVTPYYKIIRTVLVNRFINKSKIICNTYDKEQNSVWLDFGVRVSVWNDFKEFFSKSISNEKFQSVIFIDRFNIRQEDLDNIERLGLKWVDIVNFKHTLLHLTDILELITKRYYSGKKNIKHMWLKYFKLHYEVLLKLYCSMFKKYKVKVLIDYKETSWIQQVQKEALDRSGGKMFGFHWSHYPHYQFLDIFHPQHVFFVWGKAQHDLMEKAGRLCKYILPTGVPICENDIISIDLKKDFSNNVNFIIAIFDSSVSYNIYQSPDTLSQFYLNIVKLIEDNEHYGGIIKSKNWDLGNFDSLPNGRIIVEKVYNLIEKKRILFWDLKCYSPLSASRNANLSVCYGINSAGIVSGVYGYKTIHWDCTGFLKYPIYKYKEQKVFYLEIEDLNIAIKKSFEGDKSIGDFTKWIPLYNYFSDKKGRDRMVHFINSYMVGLEENLNSDQVLDNTIKDYIMEQKITDNFFMPSDWWQ